MADRTTRIEIRWGNLLSFLFVSLASPVPARSFYTSALTSNSLIFCRSGNCSANNSFYYQPIGFMTATSGEYDIRSNSSVDTVGYIFDSVVHQVTNVSGAILFDDESGGNYQFAMTISLRAMFNYTLIVTTYWANITGPFSVSAAGDPPLTFFALWLWRLKTETDKSLPTLFNFCWLTEDLLSLLLLHKCSASSYHIRSFFFCALLSVGCNVYA